MFVTEITVRLAAGADPDEINSFLSTLRQNGQVLSREFLSTESQGTLKTFVLIPESDALSTSHDNKWAKQARVSLAEKGLTRFRVKVLGKDPTSLETDGCASPNEYILFTDYLFTDYLTVESPLRCGGCFGPVPLYRLHPTYPVPDDGEYYSIKVWEADYQACDTLQMNCRTGERFGIREMSEAYSSLSRRGRGLCADIEKGTGKPVYYYLFRYVSRTTREKEEARRCPVCGGAWLLEEPWHIFDFKCETCRLVSTLSSSL